MNKFSILIKWAIRFTFVAILWTYLEKLLGYHDDKISSLFSFGLIFGIVYFITYYLTLAEIYSKVYNNKITYKSAFINLAALSILIAFLSPFPHMVMENYISPDFYNNAMAMYEGKSEDAIANAQQFYSITSRVVNGIQNALSIGILFAAIMPLFFINRKDKNVTTPEPAKKVKRKYQSTKKM
ncbi:DUF4199 domain-containing protein [Flavobacterium agricola]|uniref:DUF4199 domain-containing protein n=1 Tax=Flavobacterium agricola TaxID=2870839 RepID=A0ABY6M3J5_9FLAO|nr:DUF4199 domain-containing protein [Flavobacterium agricola]UYW02430.1 DUF4199 domain-containing protein [Flavobacterium agricola]